jgi:hypothetical protein
MGHSECVDKEMYRVMKIFRFDDVCINADMFLIQAMTEYLYSNFPGCQVMYGISPLVHRMRTGDKVKDQRIFPEILNALSDYRNFFRVELAGIPDMDHRVIRAGHGLIHVDHRLLSKEAQELSIIASCSLVGASHFIPPFNKWNDDTDKVCQENNIELVKFEAGWQSMEHNRYQDHHPLWYLHAREWTLQSFKEWFQKQA